MDSRSDDLASQPLTDRSQTIRETVDRIPKAAKQVLGAICLSRFCKFFRIEHPAIDSLVQQLWDFARIASPKDWDPWECGLGDQHLCGLGYPVPDDVLAVVPVELHGDFESLVEFVVEIGMIDAYAADTDEPREYLIRSIELLQKHGVPLPDLKPFLDAPPYHGWWAPVPEEMLAQWRLLAEI